MSTGEDWLMRPVIKGMCRYAELKDGSLDLNDVATMNEAIDVDEENRARVTEWINKKHG